MHGPTLALLVDHDDAEREFSYVSKAETFSEAEPITDVGARLGWTVVSMADDWETVFARLSPDEAQASVASDSGTGVSSCPSRKA